MTRRILVVDDNPDDIEILSLAADELGLAVDAADGADAALAIARAGIDDPPVAVLLDWSLPGGEAPTLLARLHHLAGWADVPVVVYSGSDDDVTMQAARDAGADRYEVKPGSYAGVVDLLDRLTTLAPDCT